MYKRFRAFDERLVLWATFLIFLLISGIGIARHELWSDEVHSWNISKGSGSYRELVWNRRYEGHPPVWYSILWVISKFTHQPGYMQAIQWVIICCAIFLLLFYSPIPLPFRILLPFGYYLLYEFAVFSRNYAVGIFLAFCICIVLRKEFKYRTIVYYMLLFLLSNTHLLGLLLAGSIHVYFLLQQWEKGKKINLVLAHAGIAACVLLPAVYFIFPPSDSVINFHFWTSHFDSHRIREPGESILRCLLPIPSWWKFNSWNTEVLMEAKNSYPVFRPIDQLIALAMIIATLYILWDNKKSLALYGANLLISFIVSFTLFPLTSARYSGFIFIGFVIAYWMYSYDPPADAGSGRKKRFLLAGLLCIQLLAGVYSLAKDLVLPFSNLSKINELIAEAPAGSKLVTDYWTLNAYVAYTDKPAFCVDAGKYFSFVQWNSEIDAVEHTPDRYTKGIQRLFQQEAVNTVWLVTVGSRELLSSKDSLFSTAFHVTLVDQRTGAIEKGSNLYLYRISSL